MYAPDPVDGSLNGRPDSRGYSVQLQYTPWGKRNASFADTAMNLQVGVQYTGYNRFNGRSSNYDGFDRSASDNDTVFLFALAGVLIRARVRAGSLVSTLRSLWRS